MQPLLLLVVFLLSPRVQAGKIIGGHEAKPHSRPYMAYLQIQTPENILFCGGFLVRGDFVLTAAHCLGSSINVTLGDHNIKQQERPQQDIQVRRTIRHPDYNPKNFSNDIMLLQLAYRVRQNEAVRLVALPQTEEMLDPGTQCTVAGWGLTGLNRRAVTLQEVQLTIQRDGECHSRFNFYTGQKQICVGDPREGKSTFLGDSGGPLVCNNVAQGIVSYGDKMGTPPAVFTRISSFLPWIRRTMRRFKE
uniref:Uncharacterized protein n=1 Tax=Rangifer tarandus platyrhynchus TaxID=3082113 RepID=A0ACB0E6R4_RANTA|nr:unnamed protein product [Rangifer tarandus platyrhynchus]